MEQQQETYTPEQIAEHGFTPAEFDRVVELLGRQPTIVELGIFSVMWSEHCSYKSSRVHLKRLPTTGEIVVQGPGENAGIVDIGENWTVCFKIESHNHPSFIEPFQGAATGVGGILRDIFTMGARPIAAMNSLHFGRVDEGLTRRVVGGVVSGIAHYGNCLAADERVTIRRDGTIEWTTIGELVERFVLDAAEATADVSGKGVEVLSFDEASARAAWRSVRTVFKRRADRTLRVTTQKGRTLRMTEDHPTLVDRDGQLITVDARELRAGDRLPVLTNLPMDVERPGVLDLIDLLKAERDDIWVNYDVPAEFAPEVRAEMRELVPSAMARHRYRKSGNYPLPVYLALEERFSLDRRSARVLLRSGKANPVPAVIDVDGDFARLLGYYLAEGCTSRNGTTDKIIWVFGANPNEVEYVADLRRILDRYGVRYSVRERENTTSIWLSSWFLGSVLRNVLHAGSNAYEKAIPELVDRPELVEELFKGMLRGDGSVVFYAPEKGSRVRVTWATVSRTLFEQTLLHLQSMGIVPSVYVKPARTTTIQGREHDCHEAYYLEFRDYTSVLKVKDFFASAINERIDRELSQTEGTLHSYPRHVRRDGYSSLAVRKVETIEEPIPVYDIEVDGTHNFVTSGGIITHNCFGVPTVGGEVHFADGYHKNPLVNAFALGIMKRDQIFLGKAEGVGNPVIYVGAKTGRDGIHGATMASAEFDDEALEKRPTVQVGDPFLEKLLLEACLEAMKSGAVVGIQDMGAAGLTCSTCEMGARAGTGVEIELDLVPQRETGMTPYEIMLSESQERMLLVAAHGRAKEVVEIFSKWELDAVVVGRVTDDAKMRVLEHGQVVAEIPNVYLTDEAPVYNRPLAAPEAKPERAAELARSPSTSDPNEALELLLSAPNIASKEWVYEQYDHMVRTNTVTLPGSDAAVLRVKETRKALAMTLDSNARFCEIDPRAGAKLVVAEAARNLSVSGARPLAVTNCLNFASPERPEVMWQFSETIDGMSEACLAFGTPVTGGNVSFYNETDGKGIFPTPTIGMIGLIENPRHITTQWFTTEGDAILLLGENRGELGGSEYLATLCGAIEGPLPELDLEREKAVQEACRLAIQEDLVRSAHDPSDGGLAVALAESCFSSYRKPAIGAEIDLAGETDAAALLFGESPSRVVLSVRPDAVARISEITEKLGVTCARIGTVGGDRLRVSVRGEAAIDRSVADLERAWRSLIASKMAVGK